VIRLEDIQAEAMIQGLEFREIIKVNADLDEYLKHLKQATG